MHFRVALGLLFANVLTLAAQQPPAATPADQSQTARFGAAASGVVVDVVVRDKRGRPVSNLTAADFAISEDGVRQTGRGLRALHASRCAQSASRMRRARRD